MAYSRDTQELMWWIISDFANFWYGKEVGSKSSVYENNVAKLTLTEKFLKAKGIKIPKDPEKDFIDLLLKKDNISTDVLINEFKKTQRKLDLKNKTFSLALNNLNQRQANEFMQYLFDLALDNDIPLRKQIIDKYEQEQQRKFVYSMLLKKKCVICGKYADLDHWDNVARIGGYEHDDGRQLRYLPLCREHHTEKGNLGQIKFKEKYHIEGIYLKNDNEIKKLKAVYKNHFKAFKEGK